MFGSALRETSSVTVDEAHTDAGGASICSAKGCRAPAVWALQWNNPKLHPPERRKTWLACEVHRPTLEAFLRARGFLRETDPFGG